MYLEEAQAFSGSTDSGACVRLRCCVVLVLVDRSFAMRRTGERELDRDNRYAEEAEEEEEEEKEENNNNNDGDVQ